MTISAKERAVRVVGENGYKRLLSAGLVIEYREPEKRLSYPAGTKKVIGMVKMIDGETYPVVDMDTNGYEIIFASSHERIYVEWVSNQNTERYEVI